MRGIPAFEGSSRRGDLALKTDLWGWYPRTGPVFGKGDVGGSVEGGVQDTANPETCGNDSRTSPISNSDFGSSEDMENCVQDSLNRHFEEWRWSETSS